MSAQVVTAIDATVDPEREQELIDGYRRLKEGAVFSVEDRYGS